MSDTEKEYTEEHTILDDGPIDVDARVGRTQGIDFSEVPDEETLAKLEAERAERLDPANRPEGSVVDNTGS